MDLIALASQLRTRWMAHPLVYVPRLTSTQTLTARLAESGWPEGTTALAEEQTAGRGRLGRSWWTPPGQALLCSILLRPAIPPRQAQQLTMVAAVAAAEAIEATCDTPTAIKWPNDLYVQGRKVGGILTETRLSIRGDVLEQAVVGIGINVAVDFSSQPELQHTAISLHAAAGREVSRIALFTHLAERLERRYEELLAGRSCQDIWSSRLLWIGEEVKVITPEETVVGIAVGVEETTGALLVRTSDGIKTFQAGDVVLHRQH
ncbi:MAG: biotin--[acetyl-CoA-carboxylase] ligase [Anaerolineae bacterium]|nr:biotin--[acetyl-CoA-carboxylase] ligase [Anaerolineae bacterium]